MARNSKDATYDHAHLMKDAGLVAASAAATVASVARVIDLGAARVDARVIVDLTAVEVDTGNEKYEIELQVSNTADLSAGIFIAGSLKLGDSSVSNESADTAVGRRELHFTNEINGVIYRYARLYTRIAGTIATGINYKGYLALGTR
jgi:hypothetical protein